MYACSQELDPRKNVDCIPSTAILGPLYATNWKAFLYESIKAEMSPIFCQYVGHFVLKELIMLHHPLDPLLAVAVEPLTLAKTCFVLYCWLCTKNVEEKAKKVNTSSQGGYFAAPVRFT